MKKLVLAALFLGGIRPCFAQLTQEQKLSDFVGLAALYDKNYGPYNWKREVFDSPCLRSTRPTYRSQLTSTMAKCWSISSTIPC
jgi:hypothetical protein